MRKVVAQTSQLIRTASSSQLGTIPWRTTSDRPGSKYIFGNEQIVSLNRFINFSITIGNFHFLGIFYYIIVVNSIMDTQCCFYCRQKFRLEIRNLESESRYLRNRLVEICDSIKKRKPRLGTPSWLGTIVPRIMKENKCYNVVCGRCCLYCREQFQFSIWVLKRDCIYLRSQIGEIQDFILCNED